MCGPLHGKVWTACVAVFYSPRDQRCSPFYTHERLRRLCFRNRDTVSFFSLQVIRLAVFSLKRHSNGGKRPVRGLQRRNRSLSSGKPLCSSSLTRGLWNRCFVRTAKTVGPIRRHAISISYYRLGATEMQLFTKFAGLDGALVLVTG